MIKDHLTKVGGGGDAQGLRAEADQLCDDKQYAEAAEVYDRYLSLRPDDFGIWVQRGNCLRDGGALDEAKLAYERAIELRPENADAHLQMGHLMMLGGFRDEAIRHFRESMQLDSGGPAAFELRSLGVRLKSAASPLESPEFQGRPARILDISDLLVFLNDNTRMTGIQRVQTGVVEELFADGATAAGVVVAYYDQTDRAIYALSPPQVLALIEAVGSADVTASQVKRHLQGVFASRRRITPRASDSYLILGAFWIGKEYPTILLRLKSVGTTIGVFIHDVIPLTRPQYVAAGTRQEFVEKFGDVMGLADFVVATTEFGAREVASVLSRDQNRTIPVEVVRLSHQLPEIRHEDVADETFAGSLPREYVLCVGTLEGRKNHLLLLNAWSALNRKHGGRIPHLILVGKWGWRTEEFRSQLQAQRNVGGKIVVLGSVSDGQLKHLYEHCLFTVFPSFAEGWGLPIGESLAYGKPCIASDATAMPEVGGDFCRYINPYDRLGATAEIERAILDRAGLRAWTDRIVREFHVRTWAEVAHDLMAKAEKAEVLVRQAPWRPAITLESGSVYHLTHSPLYGSNGASGSRRSARFACASGWHAFEDWGVWSRSPVAKVEFGAGLAPKTKVRVFMNLRLPAPTMVDSITIQDGDLLSEAIFFSGPKPTWVRVETETDERGMIRLRLERLGHVSHLDPDHELYFGISALAFCAKDDLAQRVQLLEALFLAADVDTLRVRDLSH